MKFFYKSTFPSLIAVLLFLAACSPEYGAHFAPSKQDNYAHAPKAEKVAPLVAEETAAPAPEAVLAAENGASDVVSDVTAPAVAPAPVAEEISTSKQKEVLRQMRDKLKGMSKEERQAFKESVLNQLKEQQLSMRMTEEAKDAPFQDTRRGGTGISPVLLVIVTILLPPLGVFLHQGEINNKFWISLLLTLLFYVPGLIYSLLVIFDAI